MKHLTKIFVGLAIVLFIVGYYLQATDQICAFINRHNERKKK
ncbi:MAG: hypothetical protein E6679_04905 [Staphylococcus epidermidis]|nr:hypothetical protein [Staphylococcus epidermidis]